jgi:D-galactonate transporter
MAIERRYTSAPARSATNVRWMLVFLCFAGTAINYVDRANLGVAVPFMQKDLHLATWQVGLALSGFFWTYAVFQLISGYLVDRWRPRVTYTIAVVWWSIFTAATALARGFTSLMGFRLLLGVGESAAYPTNAKVVSEWFPRRERATATSIFDNGARVGTALSLPIVVYLIANWGWRTSFVVTGILGVIWAAVWIAAYRLPREHRMANEAEIAHIEQDRGEELARERVHVPWGRLFGYRTIWGMMLGFFCLNFVIYFFITWFPSYLVKARHFDLLKLGTVGAIPPIVAIVGGLLGGFVSDALVRRGWSLTRARKTCLVAGMLVACVIAAAVFVQSAWLAVALLSLSYAGTTFAAASVWSLPADVAPTPHHVGSIGGIQNFASNLAGIALPTYTGFVLAATNGSFVIPLVSAGVAAIVGALSYLLIVGRIEPLPAPGGVERDERLRRPTVA